MMELSKSYVLRYIHGSGSVCGLNKVIIVPPDFNDCAIIVICDKGMLSFAKNGDQKLTLISHGGFVCDDIIVYKGQPYVVDSLGSVFRIDSSFKVVELLCKLVGLGGRRKHLVESCGELYVVDRYFEQEPNKQEDSGVDFPLSFLVFGLRGRRERFESRDPKAVEFKVYKLDLLDEEGGRWIEVKSLGDQAFFLAMDCSFSVLAQEVAGCKGNCIYFTDQNDLNLALREVTRPESSVFNLEDHSIQRLGSSQIFCPLASGD